MDTGFTAGEVVYNPGIGRHGRGMIGLYPGCSQGYIMSGSVKRLMIPPRGIFVTIEV